MSETTTSYEDMSLEDLRDEIRKRNDEGADLKVSGNKDELAARLELNDLERDQAAATTAVETDEGDGDEPDEAQDEGGESDEPTDDEPTDDEPTDDEPTDDEPTDPGDSAPNPQTAQEQEALPTSPSDAHAAAVTDGEQAPTPSPEVANRDEEAATKVPKERKLPALAGAKGTLPQEGTEDSPFNYSVGPGGVRYPLA